MDGSGRRLAIAVGPAGGAGITFASSPAAAAHLNRKVKHVYRPQVSGRIRSGRGVAEYSLYGRQAGRGGQRRNGDVAVTAACRGRTALQPPKQLLPARRVAGADEGQTGRCKRRPGEVGTRPGAEWRRRVPSAVYPHVWSSATEAAAGIAELALDILIAPLEGVANPAEQSALAERLLAARAKALAMSLDEVATLQERIRREREKLLASGPTTSKDVALTTEDQYILTVLDGHCGKALTYLEIERESVQLNRDDPQKIKRLSDSMIRQRVRVLLQLGLVVRPPGTRKKGICITDAGHRAFHFAAGNPPETHRKI